MSRREAVVRTTLDSSRGRHEQRHTSAWRPLATLLAVAALMAWSIDANAATRARSTKPSKASKSTTAAIVNPPAPASAIVTNRVIAYYFHTTQRCASCRAIEANSREALESAFGDQLKDGRLIWRVVNVDTKGNEHFMTDYKLYTKSVVLVHQVGGKTTEWKNLPKVWELLTDKPAFHAYVQGEVRGYLADPS